MDWADWGVMPYAFGLIGGLLLGLAARMARFCTLGAIEDALYAHNWDRIRMWAIALSVAIASTFILADAGIVHLDQTLYARTAWSPIASILGGLVFGYGMAIAGNCGYGALARLGGGDLRSLMIVIAMGVTAYVVLSGPLAWLRIFIFAPGEASPDGPNGYADLIANTLGIAPLWIALAVAVALAVWGIANKEFRAQHGDILWSVGVGVAVSSGWAGTSYLSNHSFDVIPVQSHSYTVPVGETLLFLMTGSSGGLSFAIGSVSGVLLGAVVGSFLKGHFRWEACDDPQELRRQILGGALMGIGGVVALGCSVGQGLTAFATLTFSAPVVLVSIFVGAALGLRQLIRGFEAA